MVPSPFPHAQFCCQSTKRSRPKKHTVLAAVCEASLPGAGVLSMTALSVLLRIHVKHGLRPKTAPAHRADLATVEVGVLVGYL